MIYQRNDNWLFPLLALIIALLILLPANALSAWDDVTAFVTFNKTRPLYNYVAKTNYFDGSLTNTSGESFQTPIRLVIDSVTSPLVTVHNADGVTDDDKPYFDFSAHLGDEKLGPGETSSARQVEFYNPNRLRFNFTWKILVEAEAPPPENNPPTAVPGGPYSGSAGQEITFNGSGSTDPDNDPLTFEWSFGDGATATGATPTHSYATADTYTVTLIVTDPEGANNTAQTQATIADINQPPSLSPVDNQTIDEGQLLTFQVTGSDPDGDELTCSANNLPEGALFDPPTRTFSWTPTYDQAGLYTTTFTVTDTGNLSDFTDVSITVKNINRAPLLDPVSDRSIAETKPLTFRVTGSDPDEDDLAYSAGNLPADAVFDAVSRTFSWAPPSGYAGTYQVGFIVSDGFLTDSISVRIFVTHFDINNSPSLTPVADQEINERQTLSFQVTGSDPNGDPLTFDVNGLPSGAAFESTADPNVFNFSWTPDFDQAGDYTMNFTASDPGGLSDTLNVDIVVNNVNRPPSLDPVPDRSIAETKPLTFQITGSDPDGDELTYSANNLPEEALFDPVAQDFSWTPTDEQAGEYDISFSVSDGDLTDSIDVHITVLDFDVNSSPSLTPVADQEINEGETLTFQVTASDPNGDDLTFNVNGLPSGAAFEFTDPNTYSFSWTPGFDQAGLYTVNFLVSDPGGLSDTMDVNITVNNVNRPPSLDPVFDQSVDENTELTFQLNGSDPDQDPLTFGVTDLPEGTTLVPETGAFSWIPTFDQAGSYEVTFFVSDGELSAEQQVLIEVIDVNRTPSIITDTIPDGRVDQTYQVQIVAEDPDGDNLDFSITQTTAPVTIDGATGQLSWDKPSILDIGTYSLTVQVVDNRGGSNTRQYILSVPDKISPAIVLNAPKQGNPGETFSAEASVSDNDAVVAVEVYGDRTNFSPPYQSMISQQKEITLPSELGTVTVHALAWDPSGNKGEAIASIEVVATFDTTPPQITLNAPSQVTPGQVILLTASVSDDVGVSTVTFSVDGTDIGTTPAQHPSIEYQIPTDAVIDSTIQFRATAVDFSGNSAFGEASSTVVGSGEEDATPPAPELQAPEIVTEDDPIPITVATPNEECLAQIDVYVNHTLAATYFAPDLGNFDVPMPDGIEGGMNVLVEVVVTDCSGNQTTTSEWINIEEPGKGVVAGEVYNDRTGLPIEGVEVAFLSDDGSTVSAITDARGQYYFVAKAGAGRVTSTKDGFTVVERTGIAVPEAGGVEAFDARLTPLGEARPAISAVLGAKMNTAFSVITAGFVPALEGMGINSSSAESADIGLDIPAGALTDNQALTLIQVSPQGLQGRLPGGWSPVGVIDISPRAISFQANLTVPNPLGFEAGAGIILATWDETEHAWQVVSSADVSADGTSISAEVTFTGQFAFLIPDVLPQPPPDAVAGELLGGITPALIPDPTTTVISPEPKIIFYKPGVHSNVGVSVSAGSEQLSSGAPVLVNIAEEYNFYSENKIVSTPCVQDIILYSLNRPDLTAAFPVTPSYTFEALTLNHGVINVDVLAPTDTERDINVITPEGGTVALSTGEAVTLLEGAASDIVPVDLEALTEDSLGIELPAELTFVGGVMVSFSGNKFDEPAGLSVPIPSGFDEAQGQLLLVQLLEVQEATRMVIVSVGEVRDRNIVALCSIPGSDDISLEGILSEGRYIFVQIQTGIGFAAGTVFDAAGVPLDGALVSADAMPVIAISRDNGAYVQSVNTGIFSVTAIDPEKMDSGMATGIITQPGDLVQLDISLVEELPTVFSFSPVDGQLNVPLETAVKVRFSEPLNPATVTIENLVLTGPEGPIPGILTLTSSDTQLTFRPTEAFVSNTLYTFTAAQGIQDLAGYSLDSIFTFSFTSLDTEPPLPPTAGSINATIPDDTGRTTITATQGTAGTHDTVSVINKTQGTSTPVLVEADGSFGVNIDADLIDEVVISITDPAGNETVVPVGQFRNPDGRTVIGPQGGQLEANNGVILDIPAGAFPNGAIVKLSSLSEAEIGVDPGPDFPFVAGFEIACSETPQIYMNASAPLPSGIDPNKRGIVAEVVEVFGEPGLSIVDTARIIDGRLTTSSPPCPGLDKKLGRYSMFFNEDRSMATMEQALLSILAPVTRKVVCQPMIYTAQSSYGLFYHFTVLIEDDLLGFFKTTYTRVCLPVPPDQPLKLVVRDANTRELIDIIDIDPISPGDHADIIIHDHNDTEGPKVVDVIPTHRTLDLHNRRIKVRFSEPISWESAETITLIEVGGKEMVYNWGDPTKVEIVDQEGAIYEGTWSLSENNSLLEFETDRPLPMGRAFKLNLNEVRDLAGNSFDGPQIRFATFEPYVVLPSMCAEGLTKNKIQNDLGCNENQLPLNGLWFIDVDFSTKTPDESYDGKWHTDIVAIQGGIRGGIRWGGEYSIFTIDASDPTDPRVTAAYETDARYRLHRIRLLDDLHVLPRESEYADPQFWKNRLLYYREDDPSIRICADPGSEELDAWMDRYCSSAPDDPDSPVCKAITGGCGDLVITTLSDTQYSYLWIYDITDRNKPEPDPQTPSDPVDIPITDIPIKWFSSRRLSDNGVGFGFLRHTEAPAGMGTPFGLDVVTTPNSVVPMVGDPVAAYVANYGIGIELVDLSANIPLINDFERDFVEEALGLNAHLYYKDVSYIPGRIVDGDQIPSKVVAIACDLGGGTGVRTLEIFHSDLSGEPVSTVVLPTLPDRIATVIDFPVFGADSEKPELHDIAFVTGQGRISVVDIPADAGVYPAKTSIEIPSGVRTKHIQVDRNAKVAYIAATNDDDEQIRCDYLLVVDVSQPFTIIGDNNNDGWDDRVIGKIRITIPGYVGPVYLQGFRLDTKKGLIYAGLYAGGDQGLAIIKVWECPDVGVDFKSAPGKIPVPPEIEKKALQQVIRQGLEQAQSNCGIDPNTITIIEQGSGSCVWTDNGCGKNYQPGISDHDFEVFFDDNVDVGIKQCVIRSLYNQVMTIQSDPIPIEVDGTGYKVYFEDISFYYMNREDFEEAQVNLDRPDPEVTRGDVLGDMGLGRQLLLLKWLMDGDYVEVPGFDLEGEDFNNILANLKKPMDVDGDGENDEPSHISRLEGYEWARLQEAMIYGSGALIRIHGASEPGTTLHKTFKKDLHKVAKAAIRSALARIIANEEGNEMAVNFELDCPVCVDASYSYDPYAWRTVACESFAHYIASLAARMVRDYPDEALFTPEEVSDKIYHFYKIKSGLDTIETEQEAVEFIAEAVNFIDKVVAETLPVYAQTITIDPRAAQRLDNMEFVKGKIQEYTSNGKKHIVPRFYNKGILSIDEKLWVRMYRETQEVENRNISIDPGSYVHLDTRKEPPPDNDDPDVPMTERKNVPIFSLEVPQTDPGQNGWCSFFVDIPDNNIHEGDRENNWAKLFYYVLDPSSPTVPELPPEPELTDILGESGEEYLQSATFCTCERQLPPINVVQTVNGISDPDEIATVYTNHDGSKNCFTIDVRVENGSNKDIKNVMVFGSYGDQAINSDQPIALIPAGNVVPVSLQYCNENAPDTMQGFIWIVFDYEENDADGTRTIKGGQLANSLNVEYRCPIAIVSLDPNPNPDISEIMYGGALYRYYQVIDLSAGGPLEQSGIAVKATIDDGSTPLTEKTFHTDEFGNIRHMISDGVFEEGVNILWEDISEVPLDSTFPVRVKLQVVNYCSEPIEFDILAKKLEFDETLDAGASLSVGGSLKGLEGSFKGGTSLRLGLKGKKENTDFSGQSYEQLLFRRSGRGDISAGLSPPLPGVDFKLRSPWANVNIGASAGVRLLIGLTTGSQYEFNIDDLGGSLTPISIGALLLQTLAENGKLDTVDRFVLNSINRISALAGFVESSKTSSFWDLAIQFEGSAGAEARVNGGTKQMPGQYRDISTSFSLVNAGLGSGFKINAQYVSETFTGGGDKSSLHYSGELQADAGLQSSLNKMVPGDIKDILDKEVTKLLSFGQLSGGIEFAITVDKNNSWIPAKLDMTFYGQKNYGFQQNIVSQGILQNLGQGAQNNITYTIQGLDGIIEALKNATEFKGILEGSIKDRLRDRIELDPEMNIDIGLSIVYESLLDCLYHVLSVDGIEYTVEKKNGIGKEIPFEIGAKLLGTGFSLVLTFKGDYAISYLEEKGTLEDGKKYVLEKYSGSGFSEPSAGELESRLNTAKTEIVQWIEENNVFTEIERVVGPDGMLIIKSVLSSELQLTNQSDFESVLGPLSFQFEAISGPVGPYHYAPVDIIGSADKPHYGMGGFHSYYPQELSLAEPATLILDYYENEIASTDESTIAIYKWNEETRDWNLIGGDLDTANNTVTTEITQLGMYTLAPAMPAGNIVWASRQTQQVGEDTRVTLTSEALIMNNGNPVSDGTVFHVASVIPYAFDENGVLPFGKILTSDAQQDVAGTQVLVDSGVIQLEIEYPANISTDARIIIFSDMGTAFGDDLISLITP